MATKVYGCSDDLIEVEGEITEEFNVYGSDKKGSLLMFSDGTVLEVKYGKLDKGIWEIRVRERGSLFESLAECSDEDAAVYSDVVTFADGLKSLYFSRKDWKYVGASP